MKSDLDCEAVERLIGAYSIGMTSQDEAEFVEAHLADCPKAAAELAEYELLTQKLLFSAPFEKAPAHLHDRLRSAVGETPSTQPDLSDSPSHVPFLTRAKGFLKTPFFSRPSFAVLTIALVLFIFTNGYWIARLVDLQDRVTAQFGDYDAALALIGADETQRFVLVGEGSLASAELLCDPDKKLAFLYAEDLPQLPSDQTYQVWLIHADLPVSVGLLRVDEDGEAIMIFRASQPLKYFDRIMVTQEPEGGSAQPTTPSVMAAPITY